MESWKPIIGFLVLVAIIIIIVVAVSRTPKPGPKPRPTPPPHPSPAPGPAPSPAPVAESPLLKFMAHPKMDSRGNNIGDWNVPTNFANSGGPKSVEECATRCLGMGNCKGFGWDPTINGGYCVSKSSVGQLSPWGDNGVFYALK